LIAVEVLSRPFIRAGVLLGAGAAVVEFLVQGAEYPGSTLAGREVLVQDILPLVTLSWLHLAYLAEAQSGASLSERRAWIAGLTLMDVLFLAWTLPAALRGAPPLSSALPIIAGILLLGTIAEYRSGGCVASRK
jgi:hypothetical protein